MSWSRDRRSAGFGSRQVQALGLTLVLGLAALGGAAKAGARFGDVESGSGGGTLARLAEAMEVELTPASALPRSGADPDWDLANLDHPRVDHFVRVFTGSQRANFARYLQRMGRYEPMISEKLAERGMPQDLIFLALVESGFNPRAYSHAHASGLWQFIPGTGRGFGLAMNRAVDERNDPEKATEAALTYLQQLYDRFGSWYLAAAAYNGGQGRVDRVMRQATGSTRGSDETFYRISGRLPRETRDYVPLIIAAARIAKDPEKYGFADVEKEPPLAFERVTVGPATPLTQIARASGTTVAEIRRLNPQLRIERTRNDMSSTVRIPAGRLAMFEAEWPRVRASAPAPTRTAAAPARPAANRTYQVRRGDTLIAIARRHGTTVRAIQQANGLRGDRIRAGATLRIPVRG
jgi:membrane-bound lytic murein transglycosylase D